MSFHTLIKQRSKMIAILKFNQQDDGDRLLG